MLVNGARRHRRVEESRSKGARRARPGSILEVARRAHHAHRRGDSRGRERLYAQVFEHISRPQSAAANVAALLRPGGYLIWTAYAAHARPRIDSDELTDLARALAQSRSRHGSHCHSQTHSHPTHTPTFLASVRCLLLT